VVLSRLDNAMRELRCFCDIPDEKCTIGPIANAQKIVNLKIAVVGNAVTSK